MKWTRRLRQHATQQASKAAVALAPYLSRNAIDRLSGLVGSLGRNMPVVSRQVADNMRTLGVYTPEAHQAYFDWVGRHLASAVHAMACTAAGPTPDPYLLGLARERVELDETIVALRREVTAGRGAVLVGPHICDYLLNLTRLAAELPLTVYLRFSRDAQRHALKQRWYRASGITAIAEPKDAGGVLGRLRPMAEAVRAGRVLFITPDLPQKAGEGQPVWFFDRRILLPPGAALLAARTRAPLYFLSAASLEASRAATGGERGDRQQLRCQGPFRGGSGADHPGREAYVEQAMQWFADAFAELLRREPALWYLWGDKRWTRVLRGDPRYQAALDALPAPPRHCLERGPGDDGPDRGQVESDGRGASAGQSS